MVLFQYQVQTEPLSELPETVTESRWHQPWSDPPKPKSGLLAHLQQYQPYSETQQFPETVTEDRWHQPWSEPLVKSRPFLTALQQYLAYSESAQFPETVMESKWHQPWSEPSVKSRPFITALQQFIAQSESAQFPESVTEDRWHQPWSLPVRTALRAAYFEFQATPYTPISSAPTMDSWLQWPDFAKARIGLSAAAQQFIAYSESQQFPENVTEDRWHQDWSLPVRIAPRDAYFEFQAWPPTPVFAAPSFGYFNALSEPVRQKLGLNAALQQFIAQSESAQFPESVTEDRWHQPWSLPVRVPLRGVTAPQDFFWGSQSPIIPAFGYFNWLAEPVRIAARVIGPQDYFSQPFPITQAFTNFWFTPLSEPTRRVPQVDTNPYEFRAINPIIPSFGYYNWLSEPVRQPARLFAGTQPANFPSPNPIIPSFGYFNSFSLPTLRIKQLDTYTYEFWGSQLPIIPSAVNASLNATEQGDLFNGLLMLYSKTRAIVSIIEVPNPPPGSPVGIITED